MPELRQLRAFVAVAEERNFTRAADRLHLAQQAVSKSVARLERELGVELLRRTTRDVTLTEAGHALLRDATTVLNRADRAFAHIRAIGRGDAGHLRLGVSPAVSPEEVNLLIAAHGDAPRLRFAISTVRPGEVAHALRVEAIDLALLRTAPVEPVERLITLAELPVAVALSTNHRLATRPRIAWRELDGEKLVTWNLPGTPYTDLLLDLAARHHARLIPTVSSVVGGQGLPDVANGVGIALVPDIQQPPMGTTIVPISGTAKLPLLAAYSPSTAPPAVTRLLQRGPPYATASATNAAIASVNSRRLSSHA